MTTMKLLAILMLTVVSIQAQPGKRIVPGRFRRSVDIPDVDDQVVNVDDKTPDTDQLNPFPMEIPIAFNTEDGVQVSFVLTKNTDLDASKTPIKVDDTDLAEAVEKALKRDKRLAFYTNLEYDADFSVKVKNKDGEMTRVLKGTLLLNGERYRLKQENDGDYHIRKLHHKKNDKSGVEVDDETPVIQRPDCNVTMIEKFGDVEMSIEELPHLAQTVLGNSTSGKRGKRAAGDIVQFDVEIMFLLDHTIYDFWLAENNGNNNEAMEDINVVYNGIMNGLQNSYANIDANHYGIRIVPRLVELRVITQKGNSGITTSAITSCTTNPPANPSDCTVSSDTFFQSAAEWGKNNGRTYNSPDHVMVFTKYDVKNPGVIGVALMSQICEGYNNVGFKGSISIVEENGFTTWATAAHELGHGLGARHDGANGCTKDTLNIMAPVQTKLDETNIDNAHAFSHCSIMDMKNTLMGQNSNLGNWNYPRSCTLDKAYSVELNGVAVYPGEVFSVAEQCEMSYGDGYAPYNSPDICLSMRCVNNRRIYSHKRAADGTDCATGKWCMYGHCENKPASRQQTSSGNVPVKCSAPPSGCQDKSGYVFRFNGDSIACEDMATDNPHLCWMYDSVRTNCPRTCHTVMCDAETTSPCGVAGGLNGSGSVTTTTTTTTTTAAPAGSCTPDVANLKLNGMNCPAWCDSISSQLDAYRDGWWGTCHFCGTSCQCC